LLHIRTPDGNTNTVVKIQASLGDGLVVGSGSTGDVELGDGNFRSNGSKSLEGVRGAAGLRQVRLGACDRKSAGGYAMSQKLENEPMPSMGTPAAIHSLTLAARPVSLG